MKRLILSATILLGMAASAFSQGDLNSQLANYYNHQNEGNDTAAYNLIKNAYFTIRETSERDLVVLDKYMSIVNSYLEYFVPCTPEEEEERGINECARLDFQSNQISTVIMPESHSARAEARLAANDYLGALEDYSAAIKARPENASYYTNRGNVKYKMKDYEGAIADFDKSISIDSSNASVFYNKGMVLLRTKQYSEAVEAFHNCTQADPQNIKALYYKGLSQYQADLGEEALQTFAAVNAVDPNNDNAYFYSGLIHYKAKAFDLSKASFEEATIADPKNEKAWYYHGISAFNLQEKEIACASWEKAKELGFAKAGKMIDDYCGE